jgi:hypothetical protein
MPKQRVPQIFTLIRFYVDPLILIPSIQHEKSDYLFQDNRFFLSDPPGARTQDPNIKSVVLYLLS